MTRPSAVAAAVACLAAVFPATALAVPGVVNTNADGNVNGTLRFEIANANDGETVTFDAGVNPQLTMGQIVIPSGITLQGNGSSLTTITGPSADRVFDVTAGGTQTVTITNLTITGGHAPPAPSHGVAGGNGGAISQEDGHLVIDGVVFDNNSAGHGGDGNTGPSGGIGTGGTGENAGAGGQGGAIFAAGVELIVRNSTFRKNFAGNGGTGGMGGPGGQGGTGGVGGGGGRGGAIATFIHTEIINTTFEDNSAGASGSGGPGGSGTVIGGSGGAGFIGGQGGAILQGEINPFLQIVNSTFNHNFAGDGGTGGNGFGGGSGGKGGGGGALQVANSSVINSTITANQAGAGGAGGNGLFGQGQGGEGGDGGAIDNNADLISTTITANRAGLGAPLGGANGSAGGISPGGSNTVEAAIIALNFEGGFTNGPHANCNPVPQNSSFSLTFPGGTGCQGAVGDPLLGPLASNGGPTQTMALGLGSPAIDQVPVGTSCPATDQRGVPRPQGPACDIGAFEAPPPPPAQALTAAAQPTIKKKKCKKKKHKHAAAAKKKKCKKKKKR